MAQIAEICSSLFAKKRCSCCGGILSGSTCGWCQHHYEEVDGLIEQLTPLLDGEVGPKDFCSLVSIKDMGIPAVAEAIEGNKVVFEQHLAQSHQQANHTDTIHFLNIDNHSEVLPQCEEMFPEIMSDYFNQRMERLDDATYLEFIKLYADKIISTFDVKNAVGKPTIVEFASAESMPDVSEGCVTQGFCHSANGRVYLNRDAFLANRDKMPYENIRTIYHELRHMQQPAAFKNPEQYDLASFLMAQDKAITAQNRGYYTENYFLLPIEADAEAVAYQAVNSDMAWCGAELTQIDEDLRQFGILRENPIRVVNGSKTTTYEIIDGMQLDPQVLTDYPILGLVYKVADGQVVKKDTQELLDAYLEEKNPQVQGIYYQALRSNKDKGLLGGGEKVETIENERPQDIQPASGEIGQHGVTTSTESEVVEDLTPEMEQAIAKPEEQPVADAPAQIDQPTTEDYQRYREELTQAYLAPKADGEIIHSEFSMIDGEKPQCSHVLESVKPDERTVLQSRTFDFNDTFQREMLEPAITDFAQCGPVTEAAIQPNAATVATPQPTVNYQAMTENNNALSIANVQPQYAQDVAMAVQQTPPIMYQQMMGGADMGGMVPMAM